MESWEKHSRGICAKLKETRPFSKFTRICYMIDPIEGVCVVKDTKSVAVTVLMPAFNEEKSIGNTVRRVKELHPDFEVLVVEDGTTDKTMQVAMDAGANVWPHPYTIGNGAATKSGLPVARGEWVVMMDADSQHNPEDIARLLECKDTHDMVVGARSKSSETSFHRDIANTIYNWFACNRLINHTPA